MFTFRAEANQQQASFGPMYSVFEADTYEIRPMALLGSQQSDSMSINAGYSSNAAGNLPNLGTAVVLRKGNFPIYSDDSLTLHVGSQCPFSVVFVMNEKGKTIDTIR